MCHTGILHLCRMLHTSSWNVYVFPLLVWFTDNFLNLPSLWPYERCCREMTSDTAILFKIFWLVLFLFIISHELTFQNSSPWSLLLSSLLHSSPTPSPTELCLWHKDSDKPDPGSDSCLSDYIYTLNRVIWIYSSLHDIYRVSLMAQWVKNPPEMQDWVVKFL